MPGGSISEAGDFAGTGSALNGRGELMVRFIGALLRKLELQRFDVFGPNPTC